MPEIFTPYTMYGQLKPRELAAGSRWGIAYIPIDGDDAELHASENDISTAAQFKAGELNALAVAEAIQKLDPNGKRLSDTLVIDHKPKTASGILQFARLGCYLPVGDALQLSLAAHDTIATGLLIQAFGRQAINEVLADPESGLLITRLAPEDSDVDPESPYSLGVTTPLEAAMLFRRALRVPHQADALRHGAFRHGLRYAIDTDDHVRSAKTRIMAPRPPRLNRFHLHRPDLMIDRAITKPAPLTSYPNKHAQFGNRFHDVCKINNLVVAVLSDGHNPAQNIPESYQDDNHLYSFAQPAHLIQTMIGEACLLE